MTASVLAAALWDQPFTVERAGEVTAVVRARCGGCSWASPSRTGAMLILDVDGRYSQHLPLTRGEGPAEYRVHLGALGAGTASARGCASIPERRRARSATSPSRTCASPRLPADAPEYRALAYAPVLHPRPNAVGRYTDVPLLMWYETDQTPRGTRIRYSVVFSNEDGGTPADRLLATWGRLTDIEYVLGVELDREGRVLEATYQAKDHKILPYRGLVAGRRPALWVVTDNNMVSERGVTQPGVRAGADAVRSGLDVAGGGDGRAARGRTRSAHRRPSARGAWTRRPRPGRTASPTRGATSTSRPARRRATPR